MDYKLIDKSEINVLWPHIEAWVDTARGVDHSYGVDDIKALCISGVFDLWIVSEKGEYFGFLIGSILQAPQAKSYYGAWLGGKDLALWVKEGLSAIEAYAKRHGCTSYSFIGRKAWQKLLGYDYEGVFYFKNL